MKINEIIVEGWFWPSKEENAKKELERQKEKENEKGYFAYLSLNGAKTAQEKDDYERLYEKYGKYNIKRPGEMSHVELQKYEQMYRQGKGTWNGRAVELDNSEKMMAWREKYSKPPVNTKPSPSTSPKPSGNDDNAEFDRLTKKLANKEKMTDAERAKFRELYDKGFGQ